VQRQALLTSSTTAAWATVAALVRLNRVTA